MTEPQRIRLTLDPGLVLERLILKRLAEVSRQRGQDWLRSLLIQGFLTEGRWLRTERTQTREDPTPRATEIPATPFARWLEDAVRPPREPPDRPAVPVPEVKPCAARGSSGEKPFAHLRNVIG